MKINFSLVHEIETRLLDNKIIPMKLKYLPKPYTSNYYRNLFGIQRYSN